MGAGLVLCAALLSACAPSVAAARGGVVDRSNAFSGGYTEKAGSSSRPGDAVAGCRDTSPSCSYWSAHDECTKNPGFMLTTCPQSCGGCALPHGPAEALEGAPLVQRGDACFIGTGPDFFVALHGHPEWGNGHTVWGRVLGSMAGVDAIVQQPLKNETWGETHVSVLVTPLPFTLRLRSR